MNVQKHGSRGISPKKSGLSFTKKLENAPEEERSNNRHLFVNNQKKCGNETVEKNRIQ